MSLWVRLVGGLFNGRIVGLPDESTPDHIGVVLGADGMTKVVSSGADALYHLLDTPPGRETRYEYNDPDH